MIEQVLSRLGLKGSYQVHQWPAALQPDLRAHQVFAGFPEPGEVMSVLSGLYPPGCVVHVIAGDRRSARYLGEDLPWEDEAIVVVPAVNADHPGGFYGLVWAMDRLLGPGGCPWDQEQTHASLKRHLVEEAYELIDAIDKNDSAAMVEELGDVLLQPVFHAQMEARDNNWSIEAPIKAITDKLIRRHPHVFGDLSVADADEVLKNWDLIKAQEKKDRPESQSVLAGVPRSLPALLRAMEVSKRVVRLGFEWTSIEDVWAKVREEEAELHEALASGNRDEAAKELGDLLFTLVNVARWEKLDAEDALRQMLDRFTARFMAMESAASKPLSELSAKEWDDLWVAAKQKTG